GGDRGDPGAAPAGAGEGPAAAADTPPAEMRPAAPPARRVRIPHQAPAGVAARDAEQATRRALPERARRRPGDDGQRKVGVHQRLARTSVLACRPVEPPYTPSAASRTCAPASGRSWRTISTTWAMPST